MWVLVQCLSYLRHVRFSQKEHFHIHTTAPRHYLRSSPVDRALHTAHASSTHTPRSHTSSAGCREGLFESPTSTSYIGRDHDVSDSSQRVCQWLLFRAATVARPNFHWEESFAKKNRAPQWALRTTVSYTVPGTSMSHSRHARILMSCST